MAHTRRRPVPGRGRARGRRAHRPGRPAGVGDRGVRGVRPRFTEELDARYVGSPLPDAAPVPVALDARDADAIETIFGNCYLWRSRGSRGAARRAVPPAEPGRAGAPRRRGVRAGRSPRGRRADRHRQDDGLPRPRAFVGIARGVRVGISTYTIALQEQVFDRELPRALALLLASGAVASAAELPRTTVLKGRERYLCVRALRAAAPEPGDPRRPGSPGPRPHCLLWRTPRGISTGFRGACRSSSTAPAPSTRPSPRSCGRSAAARIVAKSAPSGATAARGWRGGARSARTS